MKWYPWLTQPYKQLITQYRSERPHHALLLYMPAHYGEDLLVKAVGRWLMCLQPDGEKTCGHCRGCQLMNAGNHPDWHEVVPEANKNTLGIERIRQLTNVLYEHAQQGGNKVIWLPNVATLTDAAANALLKTLEEPPEKTYFLLGTHEPNKVLATIRSRCLYWPLAAPAEEYSYQWLQRHHSKSDYATIITAVRLSHGSPLKASALLGELWQQRQQVVDALSAALNGHDLLMLLPALNQDNVIERLDWLLACFIDAMKYQFATQTYLTNQDQLPLIAQLSNKLNPAVLQAICQRWLDCRQQLLVITGANKELLLTNLLVQIESDFLH